MRKLYRKGANPKMTLYEFEDDPETALTAIVKAARHGQLEAVKYILSKGVHPDHKVKDGVTSLMNSC